MYKLLEFIGTVQLCCLVHLGVHGHDSTDEEYHVVAVITPYGGSYQRDIVNTLVFQPVRKVF